MESEFIYQRSIAPCGIAIEEIYGGDDKSAKVWKLFANQIFSEAEGDYRSIEHLANGAPLLDGIHQRISVTHTSHHLVVASIPKTPDIDLTKVNIRTCIGVDLEKADRMQVLKIRDKFLSEEEQKLLPPVEKEATDDQQIIMQYILAWTCKEAMYKAGLGIAPDWKEDYKILSMPKIANDLKNAEPGKYGKGVLKIPGSDDIELLLSSWQEAGEIVTIAFSSKIPIFK